MIFISLVRWRKKPTKESVAQASKLYEQMVKEGIKIVGQYWTLGRYDGVTITEGKDEKTTMRALLRWEDLLTIDTLIAVPREEIIKLVEEPDSDKTSQSRLQFPSLFALARALVRCLRCCYGW